MAKITVASIRQQIAALEAKAQRIAADEMKTSVAKVRSLMDSLGVTLEHLGDKVSKKVSQAKKAVVGKKPGATKRSGAGTARYRDPATGATWSGFGRAPGWIASATNRDDYLVSKAARKVTKKATAAGKKVAAAAKKTATTAKTAAAKAPKPKAAKKPVASAKRAAKKSVAAKSSVGPARKAERKAASRDAGTKKGAQPNPASSSAPVAAPGNE